VGIPVVPLAIAPNTMDPVEEAPPENGARSNIIDAIFEGFDASL
jgi:hypothetical protein